MKIKGKEKIIECIKRYKNFLILLLVICILFATTNYADSENINIYYNNQKLELNYDIHIMDSMYYMNVKDINLIFEANTFYDSISAKLIITSDMGVESISKTSKYAYVEGTDIYFDIIQVAKCFNQEVIQTKDSIYISNVKQIDGVVLKNRVELYDVSSKKVVKLLDKGQSVRILLQDEETANKIYVVAEDSYYGWVLKDNISYQNRLEEQVTAYPKKVIIKCEGEMQTTTNVNKVDIVSMNMLRLSAIDKVSEIKHEDIRKIDSAKIYASVNNGQKSANYDQDIITNMISSASSRTKVITQIEEFVNKNKFGGVVIDFANFPNTYSKYFTQFIKELAAVMKKNSKGIIVNVPSYSYIDVYGVSKYADYVILQAYGKRTTASKISGATTPISYVKEWVEQALKSKVENNKIILEVNAESVLWTERKGTVINAETYSMDMVKEYIDKNNIDTKLDNSVEQNMFSYTKGITTYRMWIEDTYSIDKKIQIINNNELAGISVYKSGNESKDIYNLIEEKLK